MIHKFTSSDCPDADGRQPIAGEQAWTLSIPLEGGMDYLEVKVGKKAREALQCMFAQEALDDAADANARMWCGNCKWHGHGRDIVRNVGAGMPLLCPQCKHGHALAIEREQP